MELNGANIRPGDVVILLGAGVVLCQMFAGIIRLRLGVLDGLLILFVLYCFTSVLWSPDYEYGVVRASKYLRNLVLYFIILFWLLLDYRTVATCVINGMIMSFAYIYYYLVMAVIRGELKLAALISIDGFTSDVLRSWRSMDVSQATFSGTVNSLALWTGTTIILWLATGLWSNGPARRKVVFYNVLLILLIVELATLSRSVWLGLIAGVAWFVFKMKSILRFKPGIIAKFLIVMAVLIIYLDSQGYMRVITGRLYSMREPVSDPAIIERFDLWKNSVEIIKYYPVTGVGIGMGGEEGRMASNLKYLCVHNVYLQILAELGLCGFTIFAGIYFAAITMLRRFSRTNILQKANYIFIAGLMGGLVYYLVVGGTMADFTEMEIWIILAMISALPFYCFNKNCNITKV